MANYLVASGSRKISQLEVATNPVPARSSSVMLLVIGDAIPITNGTTVQITPDNFLTNLVFNADETYTGNNEYTGNNTFNGTNEFSPITTFNGVVFVTGSFRHSGSIFVSDSSASFSESETLFTNQDSLFPYQTLVKGGNITFTNVVGSEAVKLKSENGNGFLFQDSSDLSSYDTFLQVQPSQGDIHLKRNTVISGSLTVQEVFYVYQTASFMNSSGSTTFGDNNDDEHQFTGSIYLSGSLAIIDGGLLDGVDLSVFSASVQSESQSFASRVTQNEDDITLLSASFEFTSSQIFDDIDYLSGSYENFSGSQYKFDSGSFSDDITENSQSLSLLSASFEATSSQIFDDIDYLSGSFEATSSQIFDDIDYLSGSFEATSSQIFDDIDYLSGSFESTSASLSTRVTQNEGDISILSASFETTSSKLINASGSFSTRVTDIESFSSSLDSTYATDAELASVSQSFETDIDTLSGSISTRFTGNETDISNLQTDSGSFSTRVTDQESFSSSFNSNVLEYNNSLGLFSGSSQVDADSVTNFDSNVLTYIDSLGVVSGSSQVVFNDTSFNPFISTSAAISASNHFVPSDNEVYDLGTPTQRWRDLYLSGSTIDLGGLLIQKGVDGNVQFIDSASQETKSVNIDSITGSLGISGSVTISKKAIGSGTVVGNVNFENMHMGPYVWAQIQGVNGGTHDFSNIAFSTTYGFNSLTEKVRITSLGNLNVLTGSVVIGTPGQGIDFSADPTGSGGLSTSQLLDDYEEGTWTPGLTGFDTVGTLTYTVQAGYYTKIGNTVHLRFRIVLSGYSGNSGTNIAIDGLPYTPASDSNLIATNALFGENVTYTGELFSWMNPGTALIYIASIATGGTFTHVSSGNYSASTTLNGIITYKV